MEPEGLLLHIQGPATCPYLEQDRSSPCPHLTSLRSILVLSSHLHLGLPICFLLSGFPAKILCAPLLSPIPPTCPTHLSLIDLITRIVLVRSTEYKTPCYVVFSSSLLPEPS